MTSIKHYRKDFLNYLEETLSDERKAQFEEALAQSKELRSELSDYRRIVQMEQEVSKQFKKETFELDERFVSKVMAEIKHQPGFLETLLMKLDLSTRQLTYGIGGLAVASLCISLVYQPGLEQAIRNERPTLTRDSRIDSAAKDEADQPVLLQPETVVPPTVEERSVAPKRKGDDSLAVKPIGGVKKELSPATPMLLDKSAALRDLEGAIASGKGQESDMAITARIPSEKERKQAFGMEQNIQSGAIPKIVADELVGPGDIARQRFSEVAKRIAPIPSTNLDYYRPVPTNNERYGEFTENAPVLTSTEPMSTFSIDVDTGSYTNARRFLQAGQFPPSNAVRIEEFINYFDYNYPTQSNEPFAANFEVAPSPSEDGKYLLKVGIKAKESGFDGKEKPWNLVFLVDVSGSMTDANKLPLVQRSLELLANNMRRGDKVSIVTYAGSSGLLLPPTGIEDKGRILSAIAGLRSGGSTYGSAGIIQAYDAAKQAFIKDGVNRVILATDGDFNVGITDNNQLIKLIEEKRKSGITLTTLGFGAGNYNEAMMEQLANKGNGNYFYIDGYREARKVFEEDLYGTMEVVAKDVKLQIEFNPEHVAQYRLVGYENRKLRNEDFANDKIDAGEIGAGHTVTALYELVLTGTDAANNLSSTYRYKKDAEVKKVAPESSFTSELAFLKIRYKAPEGTRSKLLTFPLKKSDVKQSFDKATTDFRFASAVAAFASKLRGSQYESDLSFDQIASLAEKAKGSDSHGYRREFIELVKNAASARGNGE